MCGGTGNTFGSCTLYEIELCCVLDILSIVVNGILEKHKKTLMFLQITEHQRGQSKEKIGLNVAELALWNLSWFLYGGSVSLIS